MTRAKSALGRPSRIPRIARINGALATETLPPPFQGPPPVAVDTEQRGFFSLSGPEFDDARSGICDEDPARRVPPWLSQKPKLHYFIPRSVLVRGPDLRQLFMCTSEPQFDVDTGRLLRRPIGMLETQISPFDDGEIWLKYVTVDPAHQRRGIAGRLIALMIDHIEADLHPDTDLPRVLSRSTASAEGELKIQTFIDQALDARGIAWHQGNRRGRSSQAIGADLVEQMGERTVSNGSNGSLATDRRVARMRP